MNWFAITVRPQHESKVAEQLTSRALEVYVPQYRIRRRWSDRTKTILLPLFPRYVFCRFGFEDRFKVLSAAGVMSIVGFGGKACPIPQDQIAAVQTMVGSGASVYPWPILREGQNVRISGGSMDGLEGILVREKSNYRVVVNVEILNRGVAVEVEREQITPVGLRPTGSERNKQILTRVS